MNYLMKYVMTAILTFCLGSYAFAQNKIETSIFLDLSVKPVLDKEYFEIHILSHDNYRNDVVFDNDTIDAIPKSNNIPFVGVGLQHDINKRISIKYGFQYGVVEQKIHNGEIVHGHLTNNYYGLNAGVMFKYVSKPKIDIYSLIGLSGFHIISQYQLDSEHIISQIFGNEKYNRKGYIPQITPIGIRYGDNISFTAELGLGSKGHINVGVSKKFN